MAPAPPHLDRLDGPRASRLPDGTVLGPPARLMGILNVTPDSFSDGGRDAGPEAAVARGLALVDQGAVCVDVGGESTRPGATPVAADEEIRRTAPVVAGLAARLRGRAAISIDTSKAAVAEAALDAGATMVNDVTAGGDPAMLPLVARRGCAVVLMHLQGTPATMQRSPSYADVVAEVVEHLAARVERAVRAGVAPASILVDPGIGFGKTVAHNLALLRALPRLAAATGRPVVVGLSRKAFVGALAGAELRPDGRDGLSHVLHALIAADCALLRVHDVAGARAALALARAHGGGDA